MGRTLGYDLNNLRNYLTYNSNNEEIVLSLNEIEKIVGGRLPDFSYKKPRHYRFWYNDYNNNPSTYRHNNSSIQLLFTYNKSLFP